jgi:hypothetical protein
MCIDEHNGIKVTLGVRFEEQRNLRNDELEALPATIIEPSIAERTDSRMQNPL